MWLAWLLKILPIAVPLFPTVRWPVAAKAVPKIQDIAKGLYTAVWGQGLATGFGWGLTLGIPIGVISAVIVIAVCYWGFFKKVRS